MPAEKNPPAKKAKPSGSGKGLEAFRELHDKSYRLPRTVKAALDELGDAWEYEVEFLRRSGLATVDLAAVRDQFADYWLDARCNQRNTKRVWCGTVKFANKLREHHG